MTNMRGITSSNNPQLKLFTNHSMQGDIVLCRRVVLDHCFRFLYFTPDDVAIKGTILLLNAVRAKSMLLAFYLDYVMS